MKYEDLDRDSYKHRIEAQKYGVMADKFRLGAYAKRAKANGLFSNALILKEEAYRLESKAKSNTDPIWKKIYGLKKSAFGLEIKAQKLNQSLYLDKEQVYHFQAKEAAEHLMFVTLKNQSYQERVKHNVKGECGTQ